MAATLDSSGPHSATLLSSQAHGRPAHLLVLALRDVAVLIGTQLASEGAGPKWRLQIAHSVTTTLQRLSETNFDLVLVDLNVAEVRAHVADIVASVVQQFDVGAQQCEQDVLRILSEMIDAQLVTVEPS